MKKLSMKKTTAAAVTAAVGAALLLGGAGTLAYWQDEADSETQIVSAGALNLGDVTDASWTVTNGSIETDGFTGFVVPGDKLTADFLVPASLLGDNLKSEFKVTPTLPTGDLLDVVDVELAVAGGIAADLTATPVVKTFTPTTLADAVNSDDELTVTVTVEFPFGTTVDNDSMTDALSAISLAYELKQIAND